MGIAAPVKRSAKKKADNTKRPIYLNEDIPLLLIMYGLIVFGLVILYSASSDFSYWYKGNSTVIFRNQLRMVAIGTVGALFFSRVDYRFWKKYALPIMGGSIGLLILVLVIPSGPEELNRSLFNGRIQPSEVAKLATVMYLAIWLYSKRDILSSVKLGLIPLGIILGVVAALIMAGGDISPAVTVIAVGILMFVLSDSDFLQIFFLAIVAFLAAYVSWMLIDKIADKVSGWMVAVSDLTKAVPHVKVALKGFFDGGWFGVGLGHSEIKLTNLPFPHTDSIFSVVGEETGVVGASLVVIAYGALLWRSLTIAKKAPDQMGALLAAGIAIMIVVEAFVNMMVITNLLPFAGNPLPFISAGGSNLVMVMSAMGMVMSVSRQTVKAEQKAQQEVSNVIDYRNRKTIPTVPRRRSDVVRKRRSAQSIKRDGYSESSSNTGKGDH